jgi:hypothetical protein
VSCKPANATTSVSSALDQRFSSWQCKFDSVARFTIARCAVLSQDTKMAVNPRPCRRWGALGGGVQKIGAERHATGV